MTRCVDSSKPLPAFATIRAFEAVGRLSGVRRAALSLKLDHAVVSRHVRTLEEWAGVRLIHRVDGKSVLTEEGARYHARVSAALAELYDASNDLLLSNDHFGLRIWCVPGLALHWLIPRLSDFQAANPNISLELRPTDHSPDFSHYEANVDIRYLHDSELAQTLVSGVRCFEIARPAVYAVASPKYAAQFPHLKAPADLLEVSLLHEANESQWQAWFAEYGVPTNDVLLAGPRFWHAHMTLEAARRGQGVALTNSFLASEDLKSSRLVRFPPTLDQEVTLGSYVFLARADRWQRSSIVRFRLWLKEAAANGR